MNHVVLRGYIISEPIIRHTEDRKTVASLLMSVPNLMVAKGKDGNYPSDVFSLTAFGSIADTVEKYVGKGKELLVSGRLSVSTYEKDDTVHRVTEIIISNLEFVGKKETT